ncbi:MAG: AmmeMemoRadiSam system protein B, partial [Candidatus Zixiibacteriota bacterium]
MVAVQAILILICLLTVIAGPAQAVTRDPVVSGTFYPADSLGLAKKVQGHLSNVDRVPQVEGDLLALIVPHAGLDCSGQTAAYAYRLLENSGIDKVILCGPSHRLRFNGISVYGPDVDWKTPLGTVESNLEYCSSLIEKNDQISSIPEAHTQEHSLEVQLPYLQEVLDRFAITPVVMGGQDRSTISLLADALASLKPDDRTILIASTDWQHYRSAADGWPLDSLGIACLEQLDVERLERLIRKGDVEACGGGPAVAVLKTVVA